MFAQPVSLFALTVALVLGAAPDASAADEKLETIVDTEKRWFGGVGDAEVASAIDVASITIGVATLDGSRSALDAFSGQEQASRIAAQATAMAEMIQADHTRRALEVVYLAEQREAALLAVTELEVRQAAIIARHLAALDDELDGYESQTDELVGGLQGWHAHGVLARALWDQVPGHDRDSLDRHVLEQFRAHVYDAETLNALLDSAYTGCALDLDDAREEALAQLWVSVPTFDVHHGGVGAVDTLATDLDVRLLMGTQAAEVLAGRGAAAAFSWAPAGLTAAVPTWGAVLVVGGLAEVIASHFIEAEMADRIEHHLDIAHDELVHGDNGVEVQLAAYMTHTNILLKQAIREAYNTQIQHVLRGAL